MQVTTNQHRLHKLAIYQSFLWENVFHVTTWFTFPNVITKDKLSYCKIRNVIYKPQGQAKAVFCSLLQNVSLLPFP